MERSSHTLLRIIDNILDLSKVEAGEAERLHGKPENWEMTGTAGMDRFLSKPFRLKQLQDILSEFPPA